jgi:hypothetical protein
MDSKESLNLLDGISAPQHTRKMQWVKHEVRQKYCRQIYRLPSFYHQKKFHFKAD